MDKEKLILENERLIYKVIKDMNCYWKTEDEWQDLYDSGLEGLIRASKYYDGSSTPGTYFYRCIRNNICRHFYLSESSKRKINKETMLSINEQVLPDSDTTYEDMLVDFSIDIEKEVEQKIRIESILKYLDKMENKKDAMVIKMYYGLDGYKPMSYQKIGDYFGVTKEMIRVRKERAIRHLKRNKEKIEESYFDQKEYK